MLQYLNSLWVYHMVTRRTGKPKKMLLSKEHHRHHHHLTEFEKFQTICTTTTHEKHHRFHACILFLSNKQRCIISNSCLHQCPTFEKTFNANFMAPFTVYVSFCSTVDSCPTDSTTRPRKRSKHKREDR